MVHLSHVRTESGGRYGKKQINCSECGTSIDVGDVMHTLVGCRKSSKVTTFLRDKCWNKRFVV